VAYTGAGPALYDVVLARGSFLAVGGCGWPEQKETGRSLATSADGKTWVFTAEPDAEGLCQVAFGNDRFVAATAAPKAAVFTSPDGTAWQQTAAAADDEFPGWTYRGAVFFGGQFVVPTHYGHTRTSTDGEHWTLGDVLNGGAWGAQMTVAGGRIFAPALGVSSSDGVTWAPMLANGQVRSVAFGGGIYAAVGEGGFHATSADGVTWTQQQASQQLPAVETVAYGNGTYVATGDQSLTMTSPDGADWAVQSYVPIEHFWADTDYRILVSGNGRFVALDTMHTTLATSADGKTWRATWQGGPAGGYGAALTFAGGRFVAGTATGIVVSADGENWQLAYPAEHLQYGGAAWDGSQYLVAAVDQEQHPVGFTSPDGVTWQTTPLAADPMGTLTYGNGRFVALGERRVPTGVSPYILTSTDGRHWEAGPEVRFSWLRFENGLFLGYWNGDGTLYTSADGLSWRQQPAPMAVGGAAFLNGRLIVTGAHGTIQFSEPVCGTFLDLPAADPACAAVQALAARKVLGGFPDGSLQPEGQVTRAQLVKMLTLTLGLAPLPEGTLPFSDTAGHWAAAAGYLQAGLGAHALDGYPDGTFRPDGPVTRAELVKIVAAAAGVPAAAGPTTYADVPTDAWYAAWISRATAAGLIGPGALFAGDHFLPDQPATRAEAAMLLYKAGRH
jgi:hypothetical protein